MYALLKLITTSVPPFKFSYAFNLHDLLFMVESRVDDAFSRGWVLTGKHFSFDQ